MDISHTIRFGGVPEHFNIPVYSGVQQGIFSRAGAEVQWISYPGGTGAMLRDLTEGKLDMATLLTEGAISGILQGVPAHIVKFYVDSPLVWGIHVRKGSGITMDTLAGKKYAISRFTSGSHLMPYVSAGQHHLTLTENDFVVVKDLDGARAALKSGAADIFFWEKFITQPYVDNGEFGRIGECPTPWPSFVVVAHENMLKDRYDQVLNVLETLHAVPRELVCSGHVIRMVAEEFGLSHFDAVRWYAQVEWNKDAGIDTEVLASVIKRLEKLGLIPEADMDRTIRRLVDYRTICIMAEEELNGQILSL